MNSLPLRGVVLFNVVFVVLTACSSDMPFGTQGTSTAGSSPARQSYCARLRRAVGPSECAGDIKETVLYSFGQPPGGRYPSSAVIDMNGRLVGTAYEGGKDKGTIYQLSRSGTVSVLYNFHRVTGYYPYASVIDYQRSFYGTTQFGGKYSFGTVYRFTASGEHKLLHAFQGGTDGYTPIAPLINVNGNFYGVTLGKYGGDGSACEPGECGTIFEITRSGESVLYRFTGGTDGASPASGLLFVNGTFYGTTFYGGGSGCGGGCGTVFEYTASGGERVMYRFAGGTDGAGPLGSLTYANGSLYGTTYTGGSSGAGTIFAITPSGRYKQLYTFAGGADGALPRDGLIYVGHVFYGTTLEGGGSGCGKSRPGCGTVFEFSRSDGERVIYSFSGAPNDGANPAASLLDVDGTLFGTTYYGGTYDQGTLFSISL